MAYRDDRLPGSLDGVPFFFEDVTTTVGRRTKVHVFHGDRDAFTEDIGPVTQRFRLNIFLVGQDYNIQRQALVEVLNTKGPYELVHPTFGIFDVRTDTPTQLNESRTEGGMVRIGSLSLVRHGPDTPLVFISNAGRLTQLGDRAAASLAANTRFSILGAIDSVVTSITNGIFAASSQIRKVNNKIGGALNTVDKISAQLREFDNAVGSLLNTPNALMSSLTNLLLSTMGAISNFIPPTVEIDVDEPVFPVAGTGIDSTADGLAFETLPARTATVPEDSIQAELDEQGHAETTLHMQSSAVIAGSVIAAELPFESAAQVQEMLALLVGGFDTVLGALEPEAVQDLRVLKAATVAFLIDRQAQLPRVVTVTPAVIMPALVLAFDLFGDATRSRDLVARNRVLHPGFVPAEPLEVLVDA